MAELVCEYRDSRQAGRPTFVEILSELGSCCSNMV
jgi:hypothetical protein